MSSDKTSRRLTRILSVLPWVIAHDGAAVTDVVERFGYRDRADLVKDLHLVFVTGLPGYGPGDLINADIYDDEVYVDAADYFSDPLRLTPSEALGILAAGLTLVQSGQAPPALATAVEKLTAIIGESAVDAVHFDVPTPPMVSELKAAVDRRRVVRIGYVGIASNIRSERDVEGWMVSFTMGNWYLTGYCRLANAQRVFRVDRIDDLAELDEAYVIPEERTVPSIGYHPSESDSHVSFTVSPKAAWVAEYYPVESETAVDGSVRVSMSVADPTVAARLLVQLGTEASNIEGDKIREATASLRRRILTRYERAE